MTTSRHVTYDPRSLPFARRFAARIAGLCGHLLAHIAPVHLHRFLSIARTRAKPATVEEASQAWTDVITANIACDGPQACLTRSLATVVLCRFRGVWPTWVVGVRRSPPFGAHAWIEVEGMPVGESYPAGYHVPLVSVPPLGRRCHGRSPSPRS
ncbi:lasso peptide biosynthesis B2 protein [Rhodococcus sp. 2G]|uniref:lasso peptide biosynthesis B2 protein n=1 Tax=Rhodococcus sp. 2G TaxID=1570939 RepID=UPI0009041372|nr:lasso peptide biosynthesis B2 protein [Rhodococcus sp. 2G]